VWKSATVDCPELRRQAAGILMREFNVGFKRTAMNEGVECMRRLGPSLPGSLTAKA
jgi:hypothetical protein